MEYLKISKEELQKYPSAVKSINALFSPEAKYLGKMFSVGTQKRTFYGQAAIMIGNSDHLASIGDWSGEVDLATSIELTDDNIRGFIITWLLMNNLFPFEYNFNINDTFITREWIDYFGYNNEKYIKKLEDLIKEFLHLAPEYEPVDDVIKPIIRKRHKMALERCMNTLLSYVGVDSNDHCIDAADYEILLGEYNDNTHLMRQYGIGTNDLLVNIEDEIKGNKVWDESKEQWIRTDGPRDLNDLEKKWLNLALDREIIRDKTGPITWKYSQDHIRVAAKLVGRENDPGIIKILSNPTTN